MAENCEKLSRKKESLMWKENNFGNEKRQQQRLNMSVTVKINRFHLPKAKANLLGRIEFRGKQILQKGINKIVCAELLMWKIMEIYKQIFMKSHRKLISFQFFKI